MNRWGREGPPPEAYSRVTDPERFRPLHDVALRLIDELDATFDIERHEGYDLDQELEKSELARPTIKLMPRDADAAPIVIAFIAFPGLRVRFGHWRIEPFPECGCDACDETADGEAARLSELVDAVTAGRFREAIRLPPTGDALQESGFWSQNGRSSMRERLDRSQALQILAGSARSSFEWKSWPRRNKQPDSTTTVFRSS
jgi:hypothetical protein